MKNLYNAMVLFLVVITSTGLLSCTHSNNNQEISMVVDNDNPSTQHMEIIKANNHRPVQTGRFKLEDGKLLKLSRGATNGRENCVEIDQPCGLLDWCCGDLHCDGYFNGKCRAADYCAPSGATCDAIHGIKCCDELLCDGFVPGGIIDGTCKPLDYCIPLQMSCALSVFPCCAGAACVLLPEVGSMCL